MPSRGALRYRRYKAEGDPRYELWLKRDRDRCAQRAAGIRVSIGFQRNGGMACWVKCNNCGARLAFWLERPEHGRDGYVTLNVPDYERHQRRECETIQPAAR